MTTTPYIVLVGNVVEGVSPFGPFPDFDAAFQWCQDGDFQNLGVTFHITNLKDPS